MCEYFAIHATLAERLWSGGQIEDIPLKVNVQENHVSSSEEICFRMVSASSHPSSLVLTNSCSSLASPSTLPKGKGYRIPIMPSLSRWRTTVAPYTHWLIAVALHAWMHAQRKYLGPFEGARHLTADVLYHESVRIRHMGAQKYTRVQT